MGSDLDRRRWRTYVLAAILAGFAVVLVGRLIDLQAIQHDRYAGMASDEHWRRSVVPALRGAILDARGNVLATTVTYDSLYASTADVADPETIAATLAPILGASPADLVAKLSRKQQAPVLIQAGLPDDVSTQVRRLGFAGLFLQAEPRRAYPEGNLAAQLLGVVGVDGNGLSGVELQYEADLGGKPGALVAERDTAGDAIPFGPLQYTAPVDGGTLTLTIDRYVQWVAERELDAAVARHQAKGGVVVVLDPHSGAILALAARPTFHLDDPERFRPGSVALFGVPAVARVDEPGSIFKVVTLAAALENGTVTPDTTFFDSGRFDYGGGSIHNAVARPPAEESMTQLLVYSSNVGAAWVATRLGPPRFYDVVHAFGIGQPTGIDLPGEASGLLRPPSSPDWRPLDLATNAFGQGLATSPLQMAVAMATIANGGVRMRPFVAQKVAGPAGTRQVQPVVAARVVSPATAAALTRILVAVVDDASGEGGGPARVPGYAMAGKTGTAQVPTAAGYSDRAKIASFLGFGPADAPRFVILVQIDEPEDSPWGEAVAAPVFGALARQLVRYYQIPPTRPLPANGM